MRKGSDSHHQGIMKYQKTSGSPLPPVGFWDLFRFADRLDYVLMGIGTIGALAHGCALPIYFRVMANLLNSFGANGNNLEKMSHEVATNVIYYLVVGAAVCASSWAEISCWMWTGERQAAKMRIQYLEAALNQDIQFYDTEVQTSDVVLAINSDAVMVQDALSEKLGNFMHYVAIFITGFAVSFSEVWQLALVTSALFFLLFGIGMSYGPKLARLATKSHEALTQAANISEQTIVQIRTVYSYVGESKALKAYSAALKMVQKVGYKTGLVKGLNQGCNYLIIFCSYGLLIWYGGYSVKHRYGNGGEVITTISAIMISGQSLTQALPSVSAFARATAAAAKIFHIIDHKPSIDRNNDSGLELDSVHGELELKNVNFWYPSRPEVQILNDLSLVIPAGKTVALVGSSGSGKSTVVSLVERFYDPTSGQILVDGHDIKMLKLRWLRQQIGLVSQEPALFAATIKENILLGRPDASMAEIEEASRVANAHSFILKLPDGYDTQVGEKGLQLSGGQKQRIAIARAMLKNPSILLLDEATSALDTESEKLVQEALDSFMIARTTLVIAHRLSTIRKADLVAVLQKGSLVEIGRHDELIAMGEMSIYAELVKMQSTDNHPHNHHHVRKNSTVRSSRGNSFSSPTTPPSYPIIGLHSPTHSLGINSPRQLSEVSTPDDINYINLNHGHGDLENKKNQKGRPGSFWRLAKLNASEWPYALIGSVSSIICGSLNAIFAYVYSAVLGVYYFPDHKHMMKEVAKYCYVLLGISVVALIFFTLQIFFWDVVGENLTKRVKEKMLASVLKNEIAWFDKSENESSRVAARLALDANNVRSALGERISLITQNIALLLISYTVAFVLDWRLTLVLIAVFPVMVAANVFQKLFTQGFSGDLEAAHAKGTLLAGEAIANLRTVAAFNSESKIVGMFASNLVDPLRRCFWKGQISGFVYGISQFSLYAAFALGLWYASNLVKHGMSDFSKSIRVFMILTTSAYSAAETLTITPDLIKGSRAIRSVFEIIDRKTQIEADDPNGVAVTGRLRGEVQFSHVQFSYPTRPDVLVFRDLSFTAQPGETLALVGPSGCGKSSVISLIQRFYEPTSGCILIDGTDIRKFNLKSLRRHIALVPQEPCLFGTSIYENIAYGVVQDEDDVNDQSSSSSPPTEAEIIKAATLANAHKFISSLPQGYKTYAGERGVQLSGGQKQRIALARAFLKKPDIMLLDEATSALDSETEMEVLQALVRVCQGKTTIVVAHRLTTIKTAHMILVIDNGKVAEKGSDSQLLNKVDGIYARMVQLQNLGTS